MDAATAGDRARATVSRVESGTSVASEPSGVDWSTAGISGAALSLLAIVAIAGLGFARHGAKPTARS